MPVTRESNLLAHLALFFTPGAGPVLAKTLISYCGSVEAVFQTPKARLLRIPGVGPQLAEAILSRSGMAEAEHELRLLAKTPEVRVLCHGDSDYPTRLRHIPDAPILLFWRGNTNLNAARTVSIVGTRQASDYGRKMAEDIVMQLVNMPDVLMISGLAYGIDIAAHRACVRLHVPTVAVMANGIDRIYPYVHRSTASLMVENGGLLTENRMGADPDAPKFPARNRIIAGMSDVVIVVEAAATGGALITAQYANDYDREVFAVPGNLGQPASEGANQLIRNHQARIFTRWQDVVECMNWDLSQPTPAAATATALPEHLSPDERSICELLAKGELHIDQLSVRLPVPLSSLAAALLSLEMQGIVKALPGKRFARNQRGH